MLWLTVVEWSARLILLLLIFLSIWSVKIMLDRRRFFKEFIFPVDELRQKIKSKNFHFPTNHFFGEFFNDLKNLKSSENIDKAFDAFSFEKRKELERGLPILGTLGSTTPFVGLLGTILGIIVSFGELSRGTGSTNTVMFSLAEALILTAVGLVVAIPAVVGYNYFGRKVKLILADAQSLKDLYIAYKD
jgi:biopolymer transport protein ExbB/TolQ